MSIVSPFTTNAQGQTIVQDDLVNAENQVEIAYQTTKMAFVELAKAGGRIGILISVGIIAAAITFAVFKVVAVFFGALIHDFIFATTTATIIGKLVSKKYGSGLLDQIKAHFNKSIHLFSEAKRVWLLDTKKLEEQKSWLSYLTLGTIRGWG